MPEQLQSLLRNPIFLIAVVAIVLLVLALIIWLLARRGKGKREDNLRAELVEMEREHQFAAAADQLPFMRDARAAAEEIAQAFREYLGLPLVAAYAGREKDPQLNNVLPADANDGQAPGLAAALPEALNANTLGNFWKPQQTKLGFFTGEMPAGTFVTGSLVKPQTDDETVSEGEPAATPPSRPVGQATLAAGLDILVFPWRAAYDWTGVFLAQAAPLTPEALQRLREPVGRLADRLAVALEFERERQELFALDERASRSTAFSRAIIACLDQPSPLACVAHEIANLMGAESAALWRTEPGGAMVRMVAAYGLRSAEFLPLPTGQGLAGNIAQTGEPLMLENAPADPRCIFPREARESGIVGYLGVPVARDGHALGVVEVHASQPRQWNESELRTLRSAASIIAEILKGSEQRGDRLRVESAYLGLSEALQKLRTPGEVMDAVVEVLGHAMGVSRALIVPLDDKGDPMPVRHEFAAQGVKPAAGVTFGSGELTRLATLADAEPLAINDSQKASPMGAERAAELQVMSEMIVPVRVDGVMRAFLYLHQCDRARDWQTDEIEFADRVARQLSLSLASVQTQDKALREVQSAREEALRTGTQAAGRIRELEQKLSEMERAVGEMRAADQQARGALAKVSAAEAKARAEADVIRRAEAEARQERDRLRDEVARVEASAQQLLEINRLKGEFIVNAGHEIDGSLQSVLGLAELLERGNYGPLSPEQHEAVRGLYAAARRIKTDVDWLIEYGGARSRRLEEGAEK
ncbi:MAG TPA: GAF domain-containing protein [Blastocatellia bacterium]|nr:GAF domain-containing protein [Blastocatellia bacterium]